MSVSSARPYVAGSAEVDLDWLSNGWTLFGRQAGVWIFAILIAWGIDAAVSSVTGTLFGIDPLPAFSHSRHPRLSVLVDIFTTLGGLTGILAQLVVDSLLCAGLCRMAARQARGETISLGDMFKVGDILLPVTITMMLSSLLVALGYCLCIVPGVILAGLLMFAPFYVIVDGAGPLEAISRSIETLKDNWFMAGFFHVVAGILLTLSFAFCCVGEFAVIPQIFLAVAAGFMRFRGEFAQPRLPANPGGVWSPAPGQTPPVIGAPPYGYGPAPQSAQGGWAQPQSPSWGNAPQGTTDMTAQPGYGPPHDYAGQGTPPQGNSGGTSGRGTSSGGSRRTASPRQPREPWPGTHRPVDSAPRQERPPQV